MLSFYPKQRRNAFLVSLICLSYTLPGCLQFRYSDTEQAKRLRRYGTDVGVEYLVDGGRILRYVHVRTATQGQTLSSNTHKPNLLLIHGAPSSIMIWERYLVDTALLHAYNIYAVDRPGYGYSDFGRPDTSIEAQANLMLKILDRHPGTWVLWGTSYGGPVACVMAAKRQSIASMLLSSPSLAPGEEKIYSISYAIQNPAFSWFFPRIFRSANVEKLAHAASLRSIQSFYPQIQTPTTYMYGDKDLLIYNSNAAFAQVHMPLAPIKFIKLVGRPHFFTFSDQDWIRRELLALNPDSTTRHSPRSNESFKKVRSGQLHNGK
jgi:pimeloyl-ACP methyl ester carboxylesterase